MNVLKRIKSFILDLFFPNRCPFCDDVIKWDELCCESCRGKLVTAESSCEKCGKPECICGEKLYYDSAYCGFMYDEVSEKGIYSLKSGHGAGAAEFFGDVLSSRIKGEYDAVVPVPMTKKKRRMRGYNQAELIAKAVSDRTGIPVLSEALMKNSDDTEQHTLSAVDRAKHIRGLFSLSEGNVENLRILLCDDVMTTGSTVNECSRLLKNAGASEVTVICAATTRLKKALENKDLK